LPGRLKRVRIGRIGVIRVDQHGDSTREAAMAASPPRTRTEPGLTEIYNAPIVSGRRGPASLR
jgi:hypothetical protein